MLRTLSIFILWLPVASFARPEAYTELLDYVQKAPDQAETAACLFVASTGAIELIANKENGIKNPEPGGIFDLAESYPIWAPRNSGSFFESPVLRFDGSAVHERDWPFEAWNGTSINYGVWNKHPSFSRLPKITVPRVETLRLFQYGNRYSTYVLDDSHVERIKEALWKYKSPVLVNYNDMFYWHVILIVGYDDNIPGECYDTDPKECEGDIGSFYIRDSFGVKVEVRDYDWFRVKGNAAFVVKAKK